MAKAVSPDEFSDTLIRDFNWRLKELSDLKLIAKSDDITKQRARRRSLIVMCYAHWEGHAKYCADKFIEYLTVRRLRFCEVGEHFYRLRFTSLIASGSNLDLKSRMDVVSQILSGQDDRMSRIPDGIINTRSNLNSEVLEEICLVCGLPFEDFEDD